VASKSLQRKVYLFAVDALLITGAYVLAMQLVARPGYFEELFFDRTSYFVVPVLINLLAVYFVQGYHLEEIVTPWRGLAAMTIASVFGGLITAFVFFVMPTAPEFSAKVLLLAAGLIVALLWAVRLGYGRVLTQAQFKESLLIVGTSEAARDLAEVLNARRRAPYRVVGLLATNGSGHATGGVPVLKLSDLPELIRSEQVDALVLGLREHTDERLVRAIVELKRRGIKVTEFTDLYEEVTGMTPVQYVGELKMLFQNFGQRTELRRVFDEVANRGLALLALVVSLPVWPIIIVGQQLTSRGPVFVERSMRVGVGGRPFRFLKFRSMVPNATAKGSGLLTGVNDPRVTPFGRFLRKTHLDEIPQLVNVLRGDMYFIGPRAEYVENARELEKKIPFYHERHMIKPGVTGWAQVRNVYTSASEKDTLEKIQYDLYYLKNRSLALDLAIVLRTIKLILKGKGTA
jgi:exopolysaccharide biosynthesis polyprenyl glycosylphosphotransferase